MAHAQTLSVVGSGVFSRSGNAVTPGQLAVLDVVMLVDESGSETPAKVADEKQTAGTIVQSLLNPRSRVTVVGFGGVNNVVPDQDPVDVVCQPTIASQANLGYLASCVNKLHRRTEPEGDDTDYAAALGQAMSYFNPDTAYGGQSPPGAIKVILMMTDGAVDVHRDPQQYGTNWLEGEQTAVSHQLQAAVQYGVQVWPLGFGTDIGTGITEAQALAYLDNIAAHGAPSICDGKRTVPQATWVNNPDNAINELDQLYADAACAGLNTAQTTIGNGVATGSLSVKIPEIASDAVISVDRGNPGVQVGFIQPDGQQWTDSSAISGQDNSPVEVLHVADINSGEVGTWKIQLTAQPGLASQVVRATALWQGAVRAVISANPPSVKLGQPVCVQLSVLGTHGPISDAATLSSLLVGMTVSGDGLPAQDQVPISSAGKPGCSVTGAGTYAGTFTAPNQQGTLTFTGSAAGYGLFTTQVPTTVSVGTATPAFTATVKFPVAPSVQAGSGLTGQVNFTNQTGAAKKVRLTLSASGANPSIAASGSQLTAPSGGSSSAPFTVNFPAESPKGATWLQVTVVDAADPALVYNQEAVEVTVTKPPGFLAKYLWDIVGAAIVLILIVLFILWRRALHRWRVDVRGLVAILRRDSEQLGELRAPGKWDDSFRFAIRDEHEQTARLDYPQPGLSLYSVRRTGDREVTLTTPTGEKYEDIVLGGVGESIEGTGLVLSFVDRKRPTPWWASGAARGSHRPRSPRPAAMPAPDQSAAESRGTSETSEEVSPGPSATSESTDELL